MATLIPNAAEVELLCVRQRAGAIEMELRARRPSSSCPSCGRTSTQVHSRYRRTLADLPWEGLPVRILLHARKFFCRSELCSRQVFTEPLTGTVARYARRSCRSDQALSWVTLALGGRAGARLARKLGLLASRPTLLRTLRERAQPKAHRPVRVLGLDEWAWKKGHRYGTILCDLEQGRVVDLLPNRSSETIAAWLRQHPSIEVVSRDRAGAFADAIAKGAPGAAQVADRWHLLNNLFDTLTRSLERHRSTLSEVAHRRSRRSATSPGHVVQQQCPTKLMMRKQDIRQRRLQRYKELRALLDSGVNHSEAARQLGMPLRTVQRWLTYGAFPERKHRVYPSTVDQYGSHLERRYREGCRHISTLWQEVRQMGFGGQICTVRAWLRQRFGSPRYSSQAIAKRAAPVSLQRIAWLMLKVDPLRNRYVKALYRRSPEIAALGQTARRLFEILRSHDAAGWPRWLDAASQSPLAGFARHLRRDQAAVAAALQLPWSNGMVEGQFHRLKLIKRQMYGRASFDLLRLRVLQSV